MKVFIIAVLTADGMIAKHSKHLADWSSKEDKKLFVELTKQAGVMIMGANQFLTINRALPGRRTIVYTNHPEKITTENIETTQEVPKDLVARLEKEGVKELAICGGAQIYDLFLQAGVVTDLYMTYEPIIFGSGMHLFTSDIEQKLQLEDLRKLNDNVFVAHYKVI